MITISYSTKNVFESVLCSKGGCVNDAAIHAIAEKEREKLRGRTD